MDTKTWRDFLRSGDLADSGHIRVRLLEELPSTFLEKHYASTKADRAAAWTLYTEMRTRITTEPLHFRSGDEVAALDSIYALFEYTRSALHEGTEGCSSFAEIAVFVLNKSIRPFTARWHKKKLRGQLENEDNRWIFRAELQELQDDLRTYMDILDRLSRGTEPQEAPPKTVHEEITPVSEEDPLSFGLHFIDRNVSNAENMRREEAKEIMKRRAEHEWVPGPEWTPDDLTDVAGLALSGGGIRSATFSLGIIEALAAQDLFKEFDYLSTVSGGGYLGTFLSTYMDSNDPQVGPGVKQQPFRRTEVANVESIALRHLRNHSKYMLEGGTLSQIGMLVQYVHGALINLLTMAPILIGLVLMSFIGCSLGLGLASVREFILREGVPSLPKWSGQVLLAFIVFLVLYPMLHRFWPRPGSWMRKNGNKLLAAVSLMVVGVTLVPTMLLWIHAGFHSLFVFDKESSGLNLEVLIVVAGALQVVAGPLLQLMSKNAGQISRIILRMAALLTSALFLAVAYLGVFEWLFISDFFAGYPEWTIAGALLGIGILTLAYVSFAIDINHTSLHRTYRDRLSRAYLVSFDREKGVVPLKIKRLSELCFNHKTPYHLLNGSLNIPNSKNLELRGRNTDFFLFSKHFCGSPILGYQETSVYEDLNIELDLATAMAACGAAASSQMGTMTIPGAPFLMTLFNIRLGYWLCTKKRKFGRLSAPGPLYLLKELSGKISEKDNFQNVSDGGHLENLGTYELLRRRCRFIVVIDGEADPQLHCGALLKLIRFASIDLGVRIDIDIEPLHLNNNQLSREHFALGTIHYGDGLTGHLLYIKLSVTGNERIDILDYRRKNPTFPQQTTADQFFDEAQFESYRALGRHVGDALFGAELMDGMDLTKLKIDSWFGALKRTLLEGSQHSK